MITRLMLSLKKAALTENGWSFSEMTTVRRLDESTSMNAGYNEHTHPLYGVAQARGEFRTPVAEGSEGSTDAYEGIMMVNTTISEEPRRDP